MGADKAQMKVDGRRLIDVALADIPDEWDRIVVSAENLGVPTVVEKPLFGGPVAGIAAGLAALTNPFIAVMAVDAPRSGQMLQVLASQIGSHDVAVAVSDDHIQPLCSVWRRESLVDALQKTGSRDVAAKRLVASSKSVLRVCGDGTEIDYDTPDELAALGEIEFP